MKGTILFLSCLLRLAAGAQDGTQDVPSDPEVPARHHRFQLSFTWFELGASMPFKEKKLRDLPYGMDTYLYGPGAAFAVGYFGLGLYYRQHWGISVIYSGQDFHVEDAAYRNYIADRYQGHYLADAVQAASFSLYGLNYRIGYRFTSGHFIIEPQFQLGVIDQDEFQTHFVLKEIGSNRFVEYDMEKVSAAKSIFSYHAAVKVVRSVSKPERKWCVEPGLRLSFMVVPTDVTYTITSTPYQMPSTVHRIEVKQLHPAFTVTAFLSVFKK